MTKQTARDYAKAAIADMDADARALADKTACRSVCSLPAFKSAHTIMAYAALADELQTASLLTAILAAGKTLALPRIDDDIAHTMSAAQIQNLDTDLERGHFGIQSPVDACPTIDPGAIDLILVPGRAYDRKGNRVGRGAGYYDRFLRICPAFRIGLAYDAQVFTEELPHEENDLPVQLLITESKVVQCKPAETQP